MCLLHATMKNQSRLHFLLLLFVSSSCVYMCEAQRVSYHKCKLSAEFIEVTYNSDTKEIELFDATMFKNTTLGIPQTYDAKYCKCADDPHNEEQRYYCLIQNDENSCSVPSSWVSKR